MDKCHYCYFFCINVSAVTIQIYFCSQVFSQTHICGAILAIYLVCSALSHSLCFSLTDYILLVCFLPIFRCFCCQLRSPTPLRDRPTMWDWWWRGEGSRLRVTAWCCNPKSCTEEKHCSNDLITHNIGEGMKSRGGNCHRPTSTILHRHSFAETIYKKISFLFSILFFPPEYSISIAIWYYAVFTSFFT